MSFKPVPAFGAASIPALLDKGPAAEFRPRSGSPHASAKLRVSAALALGLASSVMTIGAAVVVAPDHADHEVTGTIAASPRPDGDDHYVDMFAHEPGRGWFAPSHPPRPQDGSTKFGSDP